MSQQLDKIFAIANNAIYFKDDSDYYSALLEICIEIKPEKEDLIGKKYIEEMGAYYEL